MIDTGFCSGVPRIIEYMHTIRNKGPNIIHRCLRLQTGFLRDVPNGGMGLELRNLRD